MNWYAALMDMSHVMRKPVLPYANNKGADQPAHPCSLISSLRIRTVWSAPLVFAAWIVQYLYLLYPKFKTLPSFWSWAARFESQLVGNPEDSFLVTRLIWDKLIWINRCSILTRILLCEYFKIYIIHKSLLKYCNICNSSPKFKLNFESYTRQSINLK